MHFMCPLDRSPKAAASSFVQCALLGRILRRQERKAHAQPALASQKTRKRGDCSAGPGSPTRKRGKQPPSLTRRATRGLSIFCDHLLCRRNRITTPEDRILRPLLVEFWGGEGGMISAFHPAAHPGWGACAPVPRLTPPAHSANNSIMYVEVPDVLGRTSLVDRVYDAGFRRAPFDLRLPRRPGQAVLPERPARSRRLLLRQRLPPGRRSESRLLLWGARNFPFATGW